jgi:hypothetical protein
MLCQPSAALHMPGGIAAVNTSQTQHMHATLQYSAAEDINDDSYKKQNVCKRTNQQTLWHTEHEESRTDVKKVAAGTEGILCSFAGDA